MQKEKHVETAFCLYFVLLFFLVITAICSDINIINIIYLVVVLCCSLKFILIVNENKK